MATEEVGIRLSLAGRREAAAGLKESKEGLTDVGDAAEQAGKQAEVAEKKFSRTRSVLGFLGRGALVAGGLLATTAGAAGALGIKTAASMETARIGFTTMLGSGRKAKSFLQDLADFAAKTPFAFPELQTAASRLVSAGVETNKIIPMMTTLGDVTAGMGTGSEGITRATNALQQMIAAQRISAEDLNQLRDAGIPVYDLLSKAMGKTKTEIVGMKDEGLLGKEALDAMLGALTTGKGLEKFNGLMEKQSSSLEGRWSTLKDTVTMGLADAVKPVIPLVKQTLGLANDFAVKAMPKIEDSLKTGVKWVRNFMREWKKGGGGKGGLQAAFASLSAPGLPKSAGDIGDGLEKIGDAVSGIDWGAVKDGLGTGFADTISVTGVAVGFLADHLPELAKYLPLIVAGFAAWKVAQAAGNVAAVAAVPLTIAQTVSNFQLAAAMRAQTAATATATTTQKKLNLAMRMNPLGLVITALALLVGGFVLAYKKSDTFRGFIDGLWNNVLKPFGSWIKDQLVGFILGLASALLRMGAFGVKAFGFLVKAAIWTFDKILWAAEKGLGWVPGLGDKIKTARAAFNEFGDKTIAKLDRVEAKLKRTADAIDNVARDRNSTITVTTVYTGLSAPGGSGPTRGRDDEFSGGGRGGGSGRNMPDGRVVIPQIPTPTGGVDPRFKPSRMPHMETNLYLDGKKVASNTARHIGDAAARK